MMRLRTGFTVLVAVSSMFVGVAAGAAPPGVVEMGVIHVRGDVDEEIVVFWNITRDALCGWLEGRSVGPRPIDQPIPFRYHATGSGAVTLHVRAERVMEIWRFADLDAPDPCSATAGETAPLASGTGSFVVTDSDVDVSGTRYNASGDHVQGRLSGQDGAYWHVPAAAQAETPGEATGTAPDPSVICSNWDRVDPGIAELIETEGFTVECLPIVKDKSGVMGTASGSGHIRLKDGLSAYLMNRFLLHEVAHVQVSVYHTQEWCDRFTALTAEYQPDMLPAVVRNTQAQYGCE